MMVFKVILFQSLVTIFGKGTLSSDKVDYGIAFTPDEQVAYVVRHDGSWGSRENPPSKIHRYIKKDGNWINTGYAAFSDQNNRWSDRDIFISGDGKVAFFVSDRAYEGKPGNGDGDIFMMRRVDENQIVWSEPVPVNSVNTPGYESSPVTDRNGNLYFASVREEGPGLGDFYISRPDRNGEYTQPELLKGEINSEFGEWNLLVSPDANWIIFESSGRPEGLSPYGDLYMTEKKESGEWSKPVHLEKINTTGSDLNPRILYETGRLVWASSRKLEHTKTDFFSINLKELGLN